MTTLNFPTSPSLNQTYTFGNKTWIWNGLGWALSTQGAINGVVIGNVAPASGAFTTLSATGNINTSGNISALGNVTVTQNISAIGNISGHYFAGNGRNLTGIVATAGSSIDLGNANVKVNTGGNVTVSPDGVANTVTFTPTNTTFAGNILPAAGNLYNLGSNAAPWKELHVSGNTIFLGGLELSSNTGNLEIDGDPVLTQSTGGNVSIDGGLSVAGNVTATTFFGNIVGNVTGNLTVTGSNTDVLFNNNGVVGASNAFTFNSVGNTMSVAGNVVATNFQGSGSELFNVLSDRGSDQNNWNAMIQMGVYTVNRTSWSGTTGTPLDSQVFVGLVEVKNSSNLGIVQVYSPGTVDDPNNVKIQWNRNYWNGSWTQWVRMTNDQQQIDGGGF
jgi:hypothetical protein